MPVTKRLLPSFGGPSSWARSGGGPLHSCQCRSGEEHMNGKMVLTGLRDRLEKHCEFCCRRRGQHVANASAREGKQAHLDDASCQCWFVIGTRRCSE